MMCFVGLATPLNLVAEEKELLILRIDATSSAEDKRDTYAISVLNLALTKAVGKGNFKLVPLKSQFSQKRAFLLLEKNIDIIWSVTSTEREDIAIPIRIPISKGLMGYRRLLIRKENLDNFNDIKNITDLKDYIAGQGSDWPDTEILKANALPVRTSPSYEALFKMLIRKRFDYFPRSVEEIQGEAKRFSNQGIIIAPFVMIYYPSANYFFVGKDDVQLAKLLEGGLNDAIADGSFNQLFMEYHQHILDTMVGLTVINLDNHNIPENTPLDIEKYWFKNYLY